MTDPARLGTCFMAMSRVAADISLPDRYRLAGRIANGGMASVWAAEDSVLGRMVAVKVLASHLAEDASIAGRFEREARVAASLSGHPNVVTIYDVGEQDGRSFIVMERLTGGSVADALRNDRAVSRPQALRWLREAAEALDAAHERRIVHRDVKPGNLLLDDRMHVKIADFGIARLADEATITATGQVFGTAAYLSPEQALGQPATAASDRYALAVVAYELLTGARPFSAEHFAAQARQHIEEPPPPPSTRARGLPPAVDDVLLRALDKDPARRWPTAVAFVEALDRALEGDAPETDATHRLAPPPPPVRVTAQRRRRSPALALAALGVVGLAILAVVLASGGGGSGSSSNRSAATTTTKRTAPAKTTSTPASSTPTTSTPTTTAAPANDPAALNAQGFALINAGRPADAVAPLQQAVTACGNSTAVDPCGYALFNLGHALRVSGRPADAIPYLERRLRIPNQTGVVKRELDAARREAGQAPAKPPKPAKKGKDNKGGGEGG